MSLRVTSLSLRSHFASPCDQRRGHMRSGGDEAGEERLSGDGTRCARSSEGTRRERSAARAMGCARPPGRDAHKDGARDIRVEYLSWVYKSVGTRTLGSLMGEDP